MDHFSFNSVVIIESISPTTPMLYSVGVNLKKKIDDNLQLIQAKDDSYLDIKCEIIHINGLDEWNTSWDSLEKRCEEGLKPIIHFVCHGSSDGKYLVINDHEKDVFIPWFDVCDKLERINVQNKNNTFVTMCVCHGFNILKKLLLEKNRRIPFCGLISSPDEISAVDAEIRFVDFYISLLTNKDVTKAFKAIEDDFELIKKKYGKGMTANMLIKFSDDLFLDAFKEEVESRKDWTVSYQKAKDAIKSDNRFTGLTPEQVDLLTQLYLNLYSEKIDRIYVEMRDYKFMFDLFPEQKQRFDFPETISCN